MDTKERRADADFKVPEMSEYQETWYKRLLSTRQPVSAQISTGP